MIGKQLADGHEIGPLFKSSMNEVVTFLSPTRQQKKVKHINKSRWKTTPWWETFLDGAEKISLSTPVPETSLPTIITWLKNSTLPALKALDELNMIDWNQLVKECPVSPSERIKRMVHHAKQLPADELQRYIDSLFVE